MFSQILSKTSVDEWKKQGIKMFKYKYFEQAMKCFEKCGDIEMTEKARCYYLADLASKVYINNLSN
jgi:hypothetical protein